MAKAWLTYSWNDNENSDVDFIANELKTSGIDINIDETTLLTGKRLW